MSDIERLTKLKEGIELAKQRHAELMGEERQLKSQLKEQFDVPGIDAGEKLLKKINKEIEDLEAKVGQSLDKLEKEFKKLIGQMEARREEQ